MKQELVMKVMEQEKQDLSINACYLQIPAFVFLELILTL